MVVVALNHVDDLRRRLARIDGRSYKAYKDVAGSYDFGELTLFVDHVQGDPFAAPSKIRVRVPQNIAQIPAELFANPVRRVATQDYLARCVRRAIGQVAKQRRGTGKSGLISIDAGAQEVLERTAVVVNSEWVEARMCVGLPAAGRRVLGKQAEAMLCSDLLQITQRSMYWDRLDHDAAGRFIECVENQEHLRPQLDSLGLVAFVAKGAGTNNVNALASLPR